MWVDALVCHVYVFSCFFFFFFQAEDGIPDKLVTGVQTCALPISPMPEEWVIAQSAMRYVGWIKDQRSYSVLEKALTARPKELDVTMDGLMVGGVAILGMTLRAIGVGAADGMSEWRDHKSFKPLFDYINEPKNNEQRSEERRVGKECRSRWSTER